QSAFPTYTQQVFISTVTQATVNPAVSQVFTGANTLVRMSTSAGGASTGQYWTTASALQNANGTLMTAEEAQEAFSLPGTPTWMAIGGQLQEGSEILTGEAASNSLGSGGGFQLFTFSGASIEGAAEEFVAGLEQVGQILSEAGLARHR
ncbi:MAG: hypothetical protein ACREM2_08530, partial [Vulcanimicrobiaceae bacterium]